MFLEFSILDITWHIFKCKQQQFFTSARSKFNTNEPLYLIIETIKPQYPIQTSKQDIKMPCYYCQDDGHAENYCPYNGQECSDCKRVKERLFLADGDCLWADSFICSGKNHPHTMCASFHDRVKRDLEKSKGDIAETVSNSSDMFTFTKTANFGITDRSRNSSNWIFWGWCCNCHTGSRYHTPRQG